MVSMKLHAARCSATASSVKNKSSIEYVGRFSFLEINKRLYRFFQKLTKLLNSFLAEF